MFLDALRDSLDASTLYQIATSELQTVADELSEKARLSLPDIEASHVEMCSLFAAVFKALHQLDADQAVSSLHRVIDRYGAEIATYTRGMLDDAPDSFRRLVDESKAREDDFFGPSFVFERVRDDEDAYHLHIKSCAFHRLFCLWDMPFLTALFCRLDEAWIRAIDKDRHGFEFERPATIGFGQDCCKFEFSRTLRRPA
jgi:hypothetical protein